MLAVVKVPPLRHRKQLDKLRAVTDPLTKLLELLCDLMKDFRQVPLRRNEETSNLMQGSSRVHNHRSDIRPTTFNFQDGKK